MDNQADVIIKLKDLQLLSYLNTALEAINKVSSMVEICLVKSTLIFQTFSDNSAHKIQFLLDEETLSNKLEIQNKRSFAMEMKTVLLMECLRPFNLKRRRLFTIRINLQMNEMFFTSTKIKIIAIISKSNRKEISYHKLVEPKFTLKFGVDIAKKFKNTKGIIFFNKFNLKFVEIPESFSNFFMPEYSPNVCEINAEEYDSLIEHFFKKDYLKGVEHNPRLNYLNLEIKSKATFFPVEDFIAPRVMTENNFVYFSFHNTPKENRIDDWEVRMTITMKDGKNILAQFVSTWKTNLGVKVESPLNDYEKMKQATKAERFYTLRSSQYDNNTGKIRMMKQESSLLRDLEDENKILIGNELNDASEDKGVSKNNNIPIRNMFTHNTATNNKENSIKISTIKSEDMTLGKDTSTRRQFENILSQLNTNQSVKLITNFSKNNIPLITTSKRDNLPYNKISKLGNNLPNMSRNLPNPGIKNSFSSNYEIIKQRIIDDEEPIKKDNSTRTMRK